MSDSYLQRLVITRCEELGVEKAAEFFDVSIGLVRQWLAGSKTPSLAAVEKVFSLPEGKPLEANWDGKEVFIAAPFYKSTNPLTMLSLMALWDRPKFGYRHRWGDAFIVHARNQLGTDFLNSKMPYCWWIDDDMIVPFGNAAVFNQATGMNLPEKFAGIHTPNRLRSHGKSLVGGVYFGRVKHGRALYASAFQPTPEGRLENAKAHRGPVDAIKAEDWVATGCLMHTRQVLLDMQAHFPHLAPQSPDEPFHFFTNTSDSLVKSIAEIKRLTFEASQSLKGGSAEKAGESLAEIGRLITSAETENLKHNRLQQGEDQLFCRRAKQAGHQPYVDLAVYCGHVGTNIWAHHNTES